MKRRRKKRYDDNYNYKDDNNNHKGDDNNYRDNDYSKGRDDD